MSTQDDITKLLDIQELIVVDIEIKENEIFFAFFLLITFYVIFQFCQYYNNLAH
jgi:hypothetical protein